MRRGVARPQAGARHKTFDHPPRPLASLHQGQQHKNQLQEEGEAKDGHDLVHNVHRRARGAVALAGLLEQRGKGARLEEEAPDVGLQLLAMAPARKGGRG